MIALRHIRQDWRDAIPTERVRRLQRSRPRKTETSVCLVYLSRSSGTLERPLIAEFDSLYFPRYVHILTSID